ncbi:universal stress protein [Xanthomarina sp. F1114]|uniref:universal stress protein n=1 Tax=Xanthomarina sp. F1114 TaxID=2996019 RepID=UPI00225E6256|nr:universal stress protein [Xanthomarina sp. F1114]MCX7546713.1 universal stress protein [Xanthomarina sp. F1114]
MRKILIPTDFSLNAMNAIKYALELFKYEIGQFYILHAYQDEIYNNKTLENREDLDMVTKSIYEKSLKNLEKVLQEIQELSPNPRHEYHIVSSNNLLVEAANDIVEKENIDVVVMGTRGETDDKKITFGSHTLQVLKYVSCPVLAIPANYIYTQPKHILFPTNFMIPYKRRELKLLCDIAAPYRAIIDLLYVSRGEKLSLRQEDNLEFLKGTVCKNQIEVVMKKETNILNTINEYIETHEIDMLVMVNSRHSFLENILYPSTISKLSLNLDIPFLALQNIKRS